MPIHLSVSHDVAEIVLDEPKKLNALDSEGLRALADVLDRAAADGVRALVLRGEGRGFCAGRDISAVDAANNDALTFLEQEVTPVLRQLAAFPAPTFAAAQGVALGIGLGLLIATDVVYVAGSARFGSPFANLGATLDCGGHALFFERLGAHRTLDLIYTADLMTGTEAVAAGLFSRVLPDEELLDFTRAKAARAAEGATTAFLASKQLIRRLRDDRIGLWDSMAEENRAQGALCLTDDYREGFEAFREKRRPTFTGRSA